MHLYWPQQSCDIQSVCGIYREQDTMESSATDENHNETSVNEKTEVDENEMPSSPGASWLLSGIYCMLIVILSVVICSTYHITDTDTKDIYGKVSQTTVEIYYVMLYVVGIMWLISFKPLATSCCTEGPRKFKEVKSIHSSNKWLKAILVVFGVAIIIKDTLDFIAIFQFDDEDCKKPIYFISPVAQVIFVACEVNFLFRYSKIHLQENRQISRFGAMHVMATNLSIWTLIVIDEAMEYLEEQHGSQQYTPEGRTILSESTPDPTADNHTEHNDGAVESEKLHGVCACNTTYCVSVTQAHVFLYPFLIEFSLVASCMIYIVWRNIDTMPQYNYDRPKPVYKFYQSYGGFIGGGIVLVSTMVVLIVMNNAPGASIADPSYNSEVKTLQICNSFMVAIELVMLAACVAGLVLFKIDIRPVDMSVSLDVVLLMVTLTGTAFLDVFYAFSVYVSMIDKKEFIWGAVYPVVDLMECIVQVALLLWGLSRHPAVTTHTGLPNARARPASPRTVISSITNEAFVLEEGEGQDQQRTDCGAPSGDVLREETEEKNTSMASSSGVSTMQSLPIVGGTEATYCDEISVEGGVDEDMERGESIESIIEIDEPNLTRVKIRNAMMFLLFANACIWIFWSLENTAYKVFTFPYQYYTQAGYDAPNIWHTATMFCLPLSIFFRMHSCACLFEVWSFS